VTAFVIAPIAVAIQGGAAGKLLMSTAPIEYVLKNIGVLNLGHDVGGTPLGVPFTGDWNASLWSLFWEVLCYLAVAVLGVVGLATRRWISPLLLVLALVGALLLPPLTFPGLWTAPQLLARCALMFAAGAVIYHWREVIPARWSLVALSAVIVVVASMLLPDYRIVAALPLAYACIVSGALLHHKRLRLRTDLSYGLYIYAFPVQQLLAILGLTFLNPVVFFLVSTVATLPLAALSWFLVEKRAMRLKSRLRRKHSASEQRAPLEGAGEA
jgi:peptidoglycan/LPS O-acetylase OafA/YrhL